MPCPFPGMDPYLEHATWWRGFHNILIAEITRELNAVLPDGFAANSEERVYVMPEERDIVPDVAVHAPRPRPTPAGTATTALLHRDSGAPHGTIIAFPEEQREAFVEILTTDSTHRVVTIIEVLSPNNKVSGEGRSEYVRKQ